MKIVNELYGKYYDAYTNNCDTDDELNEAKKKKFVYKQFELFDKTDKRPDKNFLKEITNREKGVDKNGFIKNFSYEPTALVNKLLSQNIQDLRKSLDEIKQQKTKQS